MGCERFREAISARLDGEDEPDERAELDAHLEGCAACRRWSHDAATVTRLARMHVVTGQPSVDQSVLTVAPARRRARLVTSLRVLLGAFGAAQFLLGMAQVGGVAATVHVHGTSTPQAPGHLWHESAAWNVAVGAGFAWIALRRGRPAGALPMLTAFVAVLGLLSVNDIAGGRVDGLRLLSHGFILAGYTIVLVLSRPGLDPGQPPPSRQGPPWRWHARLNLDDEPPAPAGPASLRLIQGQATVRQHRRTAA